MWFNNALIYKYELDKTTDIEEALACESLKPCPPHARFIYGWVPTIAEQLTHSIAGATLICLGKEERILPKAVINRVLEERLKDLETREQRQATRSERSHIAEELEFELLPKAFCVQKKMYALLDSKNKQLIINSSSENQAAQLTALLRKSIPGIRIEPIEHADNLSSRFAQWITNPQQLPKNFALGSDCLLFSPDDEKKKFTCKGYELPADEVLNLLEQGLAPSELSLTWNEHIQFTVTQEGVIKRIKCLDYLIDEFNDLRQLDDDHEQQDAEITLLSGELRGLSNDLFNALSVAKHNKENSEQVVCEESIA